MIRISLLVFLFVIIFASSVMAGEAILTPGTFNHFNPASIKVNDKGDVWTAYYDLNGGIHVRNLSSGKDLVVNEGSENYSAGLAFDVQGDNAFVVWREKGGGIKKLYFRGIYEGGKTMNEPVLLDNNTEALTRIKVGSNSKGDVSVAWYAESGTYNIWSVSSNDFGKTFSKPINLTSDYDRSIYPTLLMDEENAYTFSYSRKKEKFYMIFRKTTDGGKTWSEPVEIKEIGVVTLFIEPIKVGKRLHVFWFNTYSTVPEPTPVIEGAYSDDGGMTWKTATLEDTKGLDVSFLRVAHDSNGHIYLAMSGRWKDKQYDKEKVYIVRSEDNGTTWEKMMPIRHYPFDNTTAIRPEIMARDNNEVVVVWADYRNIRSNLYMQFSRDFGRTWQEKDIPLEEPGRSNTLFWPYNEAITWSKDRYYFLAHRFNSDYIIKDARLLLLDFSLESRGER